MKVGFKGLTENIVYVHTGADVHTVNQRLPIDPPLPVEKEKKKTTEKSPQETLE